VHAYRREALRYAGLGFEQDAGKSLHFPIDGTRQRKASATPGQSASHDSSGEERKRIWWGEATGKEQHDLRRRKPQRGSRPQRLAAQSHPKHGLSNRSTTSVLPTDPMSKTGRKTRQ